MPNDVHPGTARPARDGVTAWGVLAFVLGLALPTSTALTSLSALIPIAWLALRPADLPRAWREAGTGVRPVLLAMALLLAVLLAWSVWARAEGYMPGETLRRHSKLAYFFLLLVFFREPGHRRGFLLGFGTGILLSLAASLYAAASGHLFLLALPGDYAIFRDHIGHNLFLALAAYGVAVLLLWHGPGWRPHWLGWLLVGLLALDILFLVAGRTGQLALLALTGLLLVTHARRRGRVRLMVAAGAGVVLAFALLHQGSTLNQRLTQVMAEYSAYQGTEVQQTSTGQRIQFYQTSLAAIREHWLLGHGTGSFVPVYAGHARERGGAPTDNPHNDYLFFWLENGLPGLVLVLALHLAALRAALRMEPPRRLLLAGLVLTFMLAGLLNTTLMDHAPGHLYVALLALLLAGPWPWPERETPGPRA